VFSLSESYLIEDGKLTAPLKGVKPDRQRADVLRKVDMLGSDFELSDGIWTCGKDGPVRARERGHADRAHLVDHRGSTQA